MIISVLDANYVSREAEMMTGDPTAIRFVNAGVEAVFTVTTSTFHPTQYADLTGTWTTGGPAVPGVDGAHVVAVWDTDPIPSGTADRINLATMAHTARVAGLPQAPLGVLAGTEQVGGVTVRRDYNLDELLEGLRGVGYDLTGHVWPTVDDVIATGYGVDPAQFPTDQRDALATALSAAVDIVTLRIERSWGIA